MFLAFGFPAISNPSQAPQREREIKRGSLFAYKHFTERPSPGNTTHSCKQGGENRGHVHSHSCHGSEAYAHNQRQERIVTQLLQIVLTHRKGKKERMKGAWWKRLLYLQHLITDFYMQNVLS